MEAVGPLEGRYGLCRPGGIEHLVGVVSVLPVFGEGGTLELRHPEDGRLRVMRRKDDHYELTLDPQTFTTGALRVRLVTSEGRRYVLVPARWGLRVRPFLRRIGDYAFRLGDRWLALPIPVLFRMEEICLAGAQELGVFRALVPAMAPALEALLQGHAVARHVHVPFVLRLLESAGSPVTQEQIDQIHQAMALIAEASPRGRSLLGDVL